MCRGPSRQQSRIKILPGGPCAESEELRGGRMGLKALTEMGHLSEDLKAVKDPLHGHLK